MSREKDPVMVAVGKVAQASRKDRQNTSSLEAARAELVAARLERAIMTAFNPEEPYKPIRRKDRIRLAKLLKEGLPE